MHARLMPLSAMGGAVHCVLGPCNRHLEAYVHGRGHAETARQAAKRLQQRPAKEGSAKGCHDQPGLWEPVPPLGCRSPSPTPSRNLTANAAAFLGLRFLASLRSQHGPCGSAKFRRCHCRPCPSSCATKRDKRKWRLWSPCAACLDSRHSAHAGTVGP